MITTHRTRNIFTAKGCKNHIGTDDIKSPKAITFPSIEENHAVDIKYCLCGKKHQSAKQVSFLLSKACRNNDSFLKVTFSFIYFSLGY